MRPQLAHIALIGLMGSGKTSVGRRLAAALDRPFVDSDEEIRRTSGCDARALQQRDGRDALHRAELAVLECALLRARPSIIGTAASVVDTEAGRALLASRARTIWLDAPDDLLRERVAGSTERPGGLDADSIAHQRADRAPLLRGAAELIVSTEQPIGMAVGEALRWIALIEDAGAAA